MGRFASERNFGFGKQMTFAGKQALIGRYGSGHKGTTATHAVQWHGFCVWARAVHDVRDARDINQLLIEDYATTLHEMAQEESMEVSYAQNLLCGVNVTLEALRSDRAVRIDSPSSWVGERSRVRTDPPTGYDWQVVNSLVARLRELGLLRAAVVVLFARQFGVRLREAVLADIAAWQKQARKKGAIDVRLGTKGGRGKEVERLVPIGEEGLRILGEAAEVRDLLGCGTNLLRPDESYDKLVNDREINLARKYLHEYSIKGYHDQRAAWACEQYLQITGFPAPVFCPDTTIDPHKDREARMTLALLLGHARIDVVAEYIGARPRASRSDRTPVATFSGDLLTT